MFGSSPVWGSSSLGRAVASHATGTGIDTRLLHLFAFLLPSQCFFLPTTLDTGNSGANLKSISNKCCLRSERESTKEKIHLPLGWKRGKAAGGLRGSYGFATVGSTDQTLEGYSRDPVKSLMAPSQATSCQALTRARISAWQEVASVPVSLSVFSGSPFCWAPALIGT